VGGFGAAFIAFVVASIVLVGCVFAAAIGVAGAQDQTIEKIKAQAPRVKKWGGWILTMVGVWFLILAAFADVFAKVFPV
jgi:hypothetical protein